MLRAYRQPFAHALALLEGAIHVIASVDEKLVSHALWVPRMLTYEGILLRSAYVEAVATEPRHQGHGYASRVMRALAGAIESFDVGALPTSDPAFYARLGWQLWRGPLVMTPGNVVTARPGEDVMILRLRSPPPLDLDMPLTASWRPGDIW